MGWFSSKQSEPVVEDPVRPISQARIEHVLTQEGYVYTIDEDGDVGGRWDHTFVYFFLQGQNREILNVSGRFLIPIPEEQVEDARLFIEDWHRDHIWPKAYMITASDGSHLVCGDVTLDHEKGVSDAQLRQHAQCGIGTLCQCFEALRDSLGLEWREDD